MDYEMYKRDHTLTRPANQAEKLRAFKGGSPERIIEGVRLILQPKFHAPPVLTMFWEPGDWVAFVDRNGSWEWLVVHEYKSAEESRAELENYLDHKDNDEMSLGDAE